MNTISIEVLETAAWPALLTEGLTLIRRANRAALEMFGAVVGQGATPLSAIWAAENALKPEQLLPQQGRLSSPPVPLKFQVKDSEPRTFDCHVCALSREGRTDYLLQLFPAGSPSSSGKTAAASEPGGADPSPGPAGESSVALNQKLECALKLAGTVALDLNNALTGIMGHATLILERIDAGNPWRASLLEIEKAAERASDISAQLAAFSRQEKEQKSHAQGNLNELLMRATEQIRVPAGLNVIWSMQLDSQICSARVDEVKMLQSFLKILENSVEAIAEEGRIIVRTQNLTLAEPLQDGATQLPPGRYVCVEIADSGCGISPEALPRIFEPFFTTKPKTAHRGVGLAWVYGVVTNHGGVVAVSSRVGQGTSLRVYLPALEKVARGLGGKGDDLRGSESILLVDDEESLLTLGQRVLSSYGYAVQTAPTPQRAIQIMSDEPWRIDLVITDLVMPQMGGRQLVEKLRDISTRFRVLYASGYARPSRGDDQALYLQKPFGSQELLRKVREALQAAAPS